MDSSFVTDIDRSFDVDYIMLMSKYTGIYMSLYLYMDRARAAGAAGCSAQCAVWERSGGTRHSLHRNPDH